MCGHATSDGVHTDKGIVLRGVTKRIHGKTVLDGVTVEFPRGEISGVRGHNGSGKTMLLRASSESMRERCACSGGMLLVGTHSLKAWASSSSL